MSAQTTAAGSSAAENKQEAESGTRQAVKAKIIATNADANAMPTDETSSSE